MILDEAVCGIPRQFASAIHVGLIEGKILMGPILKVLPYNALRTFLDNRHYLGTGLDQTRTH
jgi:hypothetical protein